MGSFRHILKGVTLTMALGAIASPAFASGRCGHSYPVDAATTLTKVARACNVSYAALKEANPGVDPSYVAPGEHLAVPDETDAPGEVPSGTASTKPNYANSYSLDGRIYRYVEYTEPEPPQRPVARYASTTDTTPKPFFYQASYVVGDAGAYPIEAQHLSYQKLSAQRIRLAGVDTKPAYLPAPKTGAVTISADAAAPLSPLMECSVLRREENGKIRQVREVKPMPEGRDAPAHCISLTVPGATVQAIASRAEFPAPSLEDHETMVRGYVMGAQGQCLAISTDTGETLYLDANDSAADLVGKEATLWFDYSTRAECGQRVMRRAIYAERLN